MTAPTQPLSVRTFFLGGADDDGKIISGLLAEHEDGGEWGSPLAAVSKTVRAAVRDQIGAATAGLLDFDIGDAILGGWRTHQDLVRAARATTTAPGDAAVVALFRHRISSSYSPSLQVLVDSVPVHTILVEVALNFEVDCAEIVVRGGRLTEIRSGTAKTSGTLAIDRIRVAERRHSLVLPGLLHLGNGIVLGTDRRPTAPAPSVPSRHRA